MESARVCKPQLTGLGLASAMVMLAPSHPGTATAYERYNDGCQTCHGSFYDDTSPKGTVFPGGSKHAMHANSMSTNCFLCHRNDDEWNPYIGSSGGTAHNPPAGCTGCHGRDYGADVGNSGVGLRAHHGFAGVNACASCHDQDPAPLPEDVAPTYYGTPDTEVDDPCNTPLNSMENWSVGDAFGSDNDGDGLYDRSDGDCCPGDINLDGSVNVADFGLFADSLAGPDETAPPPDADPAHFARADLDLDEDVDLIDFAGLQRRFDVNCD